MKWSKLIWALSVGLIIFAGGTVKAFCQVSVRVPNVETKPDTTILMPILVSDVTGYGIISYQFHVKYDSMVIKATDALVENTITAPWGSVSTNLNTQGDIIIGAFGITELTGADTLLFLEFEISGDVGDSTLIMLEDVIFNNNNPTAIVENGLLTIVLPSLVYFLEPSHLPKNTNLLHNYPDPFHDITSIQFQIEKPGQIEITIYNVLGQVIRQFRKVACCAGIYSFEWNAWNDFGKRLAPGIYFCVASLDKKIVGMDRMVFVE